MEILYADDRVVVCVKPAGVLSTDEPGGLPELVRRELGDPDAVVRTVHRLDRAVSGLMVLARTVRAAADLSQQIRQGSFDKQYLAVVHGDTPEQGTLKDLLVRDKARRMTLVVDKPGKDVQEALLSYRVVNTVNGLSRVRVQLHTGRTHQIRVQFASRGWPLVGDRKYGMDDKVEEIALWSCKIGFLHPKTGERMEFEKMPPEVYPWTEV